MLQHILSGNLESTPQIPSNNTSNIPSSSPMVLVDRCEDGESSTAASANSVHRDTLRAVIRGHEQMRTRKLSGHRAKGYVLSQRYTSEEYLTLLCDSNSNTRVLTGIKDKTDCTCGECKPFFAQDGNKEVLRKRLLDNWAPGVTNKTRQNNFYQDYLAGQQFVADKEDEKSGSWKSMYFIGERKVCFNFYVRANCFTHKWIYDRKKQIDKGSLSSVMANYCITTRDSGAPVKEKFMGWLRVFARSVGDYMPDEDYIVLPYAKFEGCTASTVEICWSVVKHTSVCRMHTKCGTGYRI